MSNEPVTDLDHARYDRDGWMETALAAQAEVARLRAGIQAILDGNYPHPRAYRPGKCPHGIYYWEDCGTCTDDALAAILAPSQNAKAPKP